MIRRRTVALSLLIGCAPLASSAAPEGLRLTFPLACKLGVSCEIQNYVDRNPGPAAQDYRCAARTYDGHNGVDLRIPDMAAQRAGVDVLAAAPGRVARLRDGVTDIAVNAPGAPSVAGTECGNAVVLDHGDGWETQYCHLARNSLKVKVGDLVEAGQPIARVGLSGNTEYPHLHLTIRRAGTVIDPFRPLGSCSTGLAPGLWDVPTAKALRYQAGAVLNAGFAAGPVVMGQVEAGGVPAPDARAPVLAAYVRAIGLQGGDVQEIVIRGPNGAVIAQGRQPALDRDKAQYLMLVGRKRPPQGWPRGQVLAVYTLRRGVEVALTHTFRVTL